MKGGENERVGIGLLHRPKRSLEREEGRDRGAQIIPHTAMGRVHTGRGPTLASHWALCACVCVVGGGEVSDGGGGGGGGSDGQAQHAG